MTDVATTDFTWHLSLEFQITRNAFILGGILRCLWYISIYFSSSYIIMRQVSCCMSTRIIPASIVMIAVAELSVQLINSFKLWFDVEQWYETIVLSAYEAVVANLG